MTEAITVEDYKKEAKERLVELDVDDVLRDVLSDYFLVFAPGNYHAISSLRKRALPDISLLIDYLVRKKRATLTLDDLDLTKLKPSHIQMYLYERTESLESQRVINTFVSVFGKWLDRGGYINKFAYVRIDKPDIPPSKEEELEMGRPRTMEEIDKLFSVVSVPTPRVPRERLPMYKYWGQLLLVSCLRPAHLLHFRVGDLERQDIVKDCFGNDYVVVDAYGAVKREKEARGEMIKRKKPAAYTYLYKPLHEELQRFCHDKGWDADDPLIPIPLRSLQNRMATVRMMIGIPDFVWYDLRNTWATVIYNATAPKGPKALVKLCGWASEKIAVDAYVEAMSSLEAVEMAQKYHIFIPKVYKEQVDRILAGKKVEVTPEEMEEKTKKVDKLEGVVTKLMERIEELEKK